MSNPAEERELRIRDKLRSDFEYYARTCLTIRTKADGLQPFQLNRVQLYLHEVAERQKRDTGKVRIIVLKGRQQGCSTFIGGRGFWRASHRKGFRVFILTHHADATANLFGMVQRFKENVPEQVRPQIGASSQRELFFSSLDSGYKVGTAGTEAVGRSDTIQFFHGSEVGFWPNAEEHAKGALQAVPQAPETEVWLESTANGIGNYYHQAWQAAEAGQSDFKAVFVPWHWSPEYRRDTGPDFKLEPQEVELRELYKIDDQQIAWRRAKIIELGGENAFKQEYPFTAAEAFQASEAVDCLIPSDVVMRARKLAAPKPNGVKVIGVDPARFGDDGFGVVFREGRVCTKMILWHGLTTTEAAGRLAQMIDDEKPARMFIDVGGLGVGVYDILCDLHYDHVVTPVNFGDDAIASDRYRNKRAEMWWSVKEWLSDAGGAKIPDDDRLHADLTGPRIKYDMLQRRWLESKEDMKKRGLRSPDLGDALALTFAFPVHVPAEKKRDRYGRGASKQSSGWMAA